MIYIHTYGIGKFASKEMRAIHDTLEEAQAKQRVLGGVIQTFEPVEDLELNEAIKEIVVDEVACIIDELSTDAPRFARTFEPDQQNGIVGRIYIHTYGIGKFASKEMRAIHDTLEEAQAKQRVLGGVIQTFEPVEDLELNEAIKEIVVDEVACIIDELSTDAPRFARTFEPDQQNGIVGR
ncbi:hypothetical protein KMB89_gp19 [Citrobacter phage HCF1]|uniref:Uncharacterized protein n=1 Tax=Citrobacter phage HCF1 TaxID=2849700 RepID=A0ABX6D3M0_9CAUD|nr:hypothetical protein KMB89_gp19 [Citrobacter phage HCF1]